MCGFIKETEVKLEAAMFTEIAVSWPCKRFGRAGMRGI